MDQLLRDKILQHMLYRKECTAMLICYGLGYSLERYSAVRTALEAMLAAGEIEYNAARLTWRLPNEGRGQCLA